MTFLTIILFLLSYRLQAPIFQLWRLQASKSREESKFVCWHFRKRSKNLYCATSFCSAMLHGGPFALLNFALHVLIIISKHFALYVFCLSKSPSWKEHKHSCMSRSSFNEISLLQKKNFHIYIFCNIYPTFTSYNF